MSIQDKLDYLHETKSAIKNAIAEKGVEIYDDDSFRSYADKIAEIETEPNLQEKTVTPTASSQEVVADEGYDALSKVEVEGDSNLVAENIKQGVSIFGVTGTCQGNASDDENGSTSESSKFNVFAQSAEPETKNGIWIKGGETSDVYFGAYFTQKGDFIENSGFGYLNTTSVMLGQVVIGDYLYVFGPTKATSYKYNLRTKKLVGNINAPSVTYHSEYVGAVYYAENDEVYVFYRKYTSSSNYDFKYYIYYPSTDTYSSVDQTMNSYTGYMYNSAPHLYNGKIYIYYVNRTTASSSGCSILDLNTKTSTYKTIGGTNYVVSSYGAGKYIYILGGYSGHDLYRYDCDANILTYLKDIYTDTYGYADGVFATGNKVYIFYGSSTTPIYRIYDVETGALTDVVPNISYTIDTGKTDDKQKLFFDSTEGLLYFRSPNFATSVFQFEDSPSLAGLETGTAVIIQDLGYVRPVVIQDISNLQIGVQDVFIMNSDGELDGDLIVYLGNGTEWSLLKGRVKVTFDSDGGSEVSSVSVKYGETVSAPAIPSKDGYEFIRWTLNGSEYDFSTPVTENITLVAEWTEINPTFVDYIESTGTQYIDTGFIPNQDTKVEMEVSFNDVTTQETLWCARDSVSQNAFNMFKIETNFRSDYNVSLQTLSALTLVTGTKYKACMDKNKAYIDDVLMFTHEASTFSQSATMLLMMDFQGNHGTNIQRPGAFKMYSCKIYDNGTLVRDFKPCKDTHGVYCLYDAVSNRYFYNAGTGEFKGDIPGVTQLNYIESTGTQYIDTEIMPNQDTKIEAELYIPTPSVGSFLYCARNAGTEAQFGCWLREPYESAPAYLQPRYGTTNQEYITFDVNSINTIVQNKNNFNVNGTSVTWNTQTFNTNYSLCILASNTAGTIGNFGISGIKIYSFKIYDNGTLVRDYIPALDDSGVACLYDKVSETYFYNAGTGSFIAG